jgi:hypothetical protein
MATTTRLNNASVLNQPHKAYVTTGAFATDIYSYSVSTSLTNGEFVTTGTLTALGASVVTSTYNVAGTVLRENGKKLVPGVNPSITQYYVGVYHPVFGSGYIDPNGPLFALYNSDKAYNGTGSGDLLENDLGPPVITAGVVTATGAITTSSSVTAAGGITSSSSTAGVGYSTGAGGVNTANSATPNGSVTIGKNCGQITLGDGTNFTVGGATVNTYGGSGSYTPTIDPISVYLDVVVGSLASTDVVLANFQNDPNDNVQVSVYRVGVAANTFRLRFINYGTTSANLNGAKVNFAVFRSVAA